MHEYNQKLNLKEEKEDKIKKKLRKIKKNQHKIQNIQNDVKEEENNRTISGIIKDYSSINSNNNNLIIIFSAEIKLKTEISTKR